MNANQITNEQVAEVLDHIYPEWWLEWAREDDLRDVARGAMTTKELRSRVTFHKVTWVAQAMTLLVNKPA